MLVVIEYFAKSLKIIGNSVRDAIPLNYIIFPIRMTNIIVTHRNVR